MECFVRERVHRMLSVWVMVHGGLGVDACSVSSPPTSSTGVRYARFVCRFCALNELLSSGPNATKSATRAQPLMLSNVSVFGCKEDGFLSFVKESVRNTVRDTLLIVGAGIFPETCRHHNLEEIQVRVCGMVCTEVLDGCVVQSGASSRLSGTGCRLFGESCFMVWFSETGFGCW